ncbi:beta-ketothiolase BktB [Sphingomonas sp. NIBR02145]|uniref:beta-ketothiolase BktB n=1 Tax=Sphingomonas sp. NIBR02145 TaxID=3014784 RepID=UPI0022B3E2BB|nr:beta-ketothiolase BktB [Sphingomonas sp. NIBR02145]WHU04517.1 beta-ketothiolase BktB [Sphingomonas sp. NIBR02145]
MTAEVFIVAARRTAIGTFGGALGAETPGNLAATVTRAALDAAGVAPEAVGHVVFGQVIPTAPRDAYLARVAGIEAGIPKEVPALTVNRLCGSGVQAIVSAAQMLMLGDAEIAVAGGAEVMSRAPYYAPATRWGQKMGDATLVDGLNGALTDPFGGGLMGVTAENVAERHGIDRARQDAYAAESHARAVRAIAEGRFDGQIVPIEVKAGRATRVFDVDEHVRADANAADLAKLRTIFKAGGSVTAGNASGINDGAAAVVLASEKAVAEHGLTPMARIVAYGHAGVDPDYMGMGPVPATRAALARAGLSVADMDVIESNEAFAAQACAVSDALGFDPAKVNPNGSGISLGHPVGATGAIIVTKLVHELARVGGRYGLATMCIGGGQGIALVVERV